MKPTPHQSSSGAPCSETGPGSLTSTIVVPPVTTLSARPDTISTYLLPILLGQGPETQKFIGNRSLGRPAGQCYGRPTGTVGRPRPERPARPRDHQGTPLTALRRRRLRPPPAGRGRAGAARRRPRGGGAPPGPGGPRTRAWLTATP